MEVHSHTHSPRKKWTHYFWEFLMLFLAVFCGFLAENFREHKIEKERAEQYIFSFCSDLKRDTARFSLVMKFDEEKLNTLQNIFSCYDSLLKNWKETTCLIEIARKSATNSAIGFNDGTMQQLKNAGGFRLLDKEDRDSIINYDNVIKIYKDFESTVFQQSQDIIRGTFSRLHDFKANKFLYRVAAGKDSSQIEMPITFKDDKELLNEYFNDLFRYRFVTANQYKRLIDFKEQATRLLEYFNNKYHFDR